MSLSGLLLQEKKIQNWNYNKHNFNYCLNNILTSFIYLSNIERKERKKEALSQWKTIKKKKKNNLHLHKNNKQIQSIYDSLI